MKPHHENRADHDRRRVTPPPQWNQQSVIGFAASCIAAFVVTVGSIGEGACLSVDGCPSTSRAVPHATIALFVVLGLVTAYAVVAKFTHRARATRLSATVGVLVLISLLVLDA